MLWCVCVILLCYLKFDIGAAESSLPASPAHTCVVGAGFSGLAAARYLIQYGLNFTVYEGSGDIGGIWRFDPRVGTDEYGVPIHTSQYKYLRVNTPHQMMGFNGFPFPEDIRSYPTGSCFFKYVKSFAREFGLMKYIKLHSYVTSVKLEGDHWNLIYSDVKSKTNYTVHCDFIIIASGQNALPFTPVLEGQGDFKGTILHSHDYKDPEDYKDRNVLLVGAGGSGLDLSIHLLNIANKVVHSHHLDFKQPQYPGNFVKKPDIKAFKANGVVFKDDSFEEVDTVIFCTGYLYVQPYIHENAELWTDTSIRYLHLNMINIRHPTMGFIGVMPLGFPKILDAQAQYIASLAAGKFQLPSKEQMKSTFDTLLTLDLVKHKADVKDMYVYFATINKESGIVTMPPVFIKILEFILPNMLQELFLYRDYDFEIIDDYNYKRWYNPRNETCDIPE